jgi:hypothetical protein
MFLTRNEWIAKMTQAGLDATDAAYDEMVAECYRLGLVEHFANVEFASMTDGMRDWMDRNGVETYNRTRKDVVRECMEELHIPRTTENVVAWLDACNPVTLLND